jgi:hypothetical protein
MGSTISKQRAPVPVPEEKITNLSIVKNLSTQFWNRIRLSIKNGKVCWYMNGNIKQYIPRLGAIQDYINSTFLNESGMEMTLASYNTYYECKKCDKNHTIYLIDPRACTQCGEDITKYIDEYIVVSVNIYDSTPPVKNQEYM